MRRLFSIVSYLLGPALLYVTAADSYTNWWAFQLYLGYLCLRCGRRGLRAGQLSQIENGRRVLLPTLGWSLLECGLVCPWLFTKWTADEGMAWAGFLAGLACFYSNLGVWSGLKRDSLSAAQIVYGWPILWGVGQVAAPMVARNADQFLLFSPWNFGGANWACLAAHWSGGLLLYLAVPERAKRLEQEEDAPQKVSWVWNLLTYIVLVTGPVLLETRSWQNPAALSLSAHFLYWSIVAQQRGIRSNHSTRTWAELRNSAVSLSLRQCLIFLPILLLVLISLRPMGVSVTDFSTIILLTVGAVGGWTSLALALSFLSGSRQRASAISLLALVFCTLSGPLMDRGGSFPVLSLLSPLYAGYALLGGYYVTGGLSYVVPMGFYLCLWMVSQALGRRASAPKPENSEAGA